jgi:predicted transcriptional regulator
MEVQPYPPSMDRKIRPLVRQRKAVAEKAHRLLQAAVVEAYGRPGVYVTMAQVMKRSNIPDQKEYQTIAKHLEKEGWIAEADPDYGVFVLTHEGIDKATH